MSPLPDLRTVMLTEEVSVADLHSLDDFDAALAQLTVDIALIAGQLDDESHPANADPVWRRRASSALRIKRGIHSIVIARRAEKAREIKRAAGESRSVRLLQRLRELCPAEFQAAAREIDGVAA